MHLGIYFGGDVAHLYAVPILVDNVGLESQVLVPATQYSVAIIDQLSTLLVPRKQHPNEDHLNCIYIQHIQFC